MIIEIKIKMPASIFFWWNKKFRARNWLIATLERMWIVLPLPVIPNEVKYEETLEEGEEEFEELIIESLEWPL